MKNALLSLLFALFTTLPLSLAVEPVIDRTGKPLSPRGRYYILPSPTGTDRKGGGGVKYGKTTTDKSSCSYAVFQDYSEAVKGLPVGFYTNQSTDPDVITPSTTLLSIEFGVVPGCAETYKWVVVDDGFFLPWVAIGGPKNLPGKKIIDGTFRIERYRAIIECKLVFCPRATGKCLDVWRIDDTEEGRRLVVTDNAIEPYVVVFENALTGGRSVV